MKLDGLFDIATHHRDGDEHTFGVRLDSSHPVFAGHFPGTPVLPGVCSMMIVKRCAAEAAGRRFSYRTVRDCKFLSAIVPDKHTRLSVFLVMTPGDDGEWTITAEIRAQETTMVKIRAGLSEE